MDVVIMKTKYSNEYASCVTMPSKYMPDGVTELSALLTDPAHRREGFATELLQEVCNEADIEGAILALSPVDADTQKFYERFGFIEIQPRPVLMARAPQIFKVKYSMTNAAAMSAINGR